MALNFAATDANALVDGNERFLINFLFKTFVVLRCRIDFGSVASAAARDNLEKSDGEPLDIAFAFARVDVNQNLNLLTDRVAAARNTRLKEAKKQCAI